MNAGGERIRRIALPTPFRVGDVNVYLIEGEGRVLVDTGPETDEAWAALQARLREVGLKVRDLDAIVLTHHHIDHVGLAARILDEKPLPVYAHPQAAPYVGKAEAFLAERAAFLRTLYQKSGVPEPLIAEAEEVYRAYLRFFRPVPAIRPVREGATLPELPGWTVLETPGHAPDHVALFCPDEGLLIGGDHLLLHISSNAFVEPAYGTPLRPRSLVVYREALERLLDLPIGRVLPGHGEAVAEPAALIRERLRQQLERAELLRGLLAEEATAFGISQRLFPKLFRTELPLVLSEVVGHLDLLVELGRATVEDGPIIRYRPAD
ncbi:MBL fold metallo-hydrolase [Hydrogenibacillus schlegelii]|nr:MBL fold metallo-hydrolase [Hydrogenibacillus schlegelii]